MIRFLGKEKPSSPIISYKESSVKMGDETKVKSFPLCVHLLSSIGERRLILEERSVERKRQRIALPMLSIFNTLPLWH